MHESKVTTLQREVKYTRILLDVLVRMQVPHIIFYSGAGRTVKVQGNVMEAMITLEPLPEGMVRVHIQSKGSLTREYKDTLLALKLNELVKTLEGVS